MRTDKVLQPLTLSIELYSEGFSDARFRSNSGYSIPRDINPIRVDGVDLVRSEQKLYGRGLNIAVIDPENGALCNFHVFDTCNIEQSNEDPRNQKIRSALRRFIKNVADGKIIALITLDDAVYNLYSRSNASENEALDKLFKSLGSKAFLKLNPYRKKEDLSRSESFRSAWTLLSIKGRKIALGESFVTRIVNPENPLDATQYAKSGICINWQPNIRISNLGGSKSFSWLHVLAFAGLGLAQIAAGIFLEMGTVGILIPVGAVLITEGIGDIIYAIRAGVTGQSSWTEYGKHKASSIPQNALTIGFLGLNAIAGEGLAALSIGATNLGAAALDKVLVYAAGRLTLEAGKTIVGKIAEYGLSFVCDHLLHEINKLIGNKIHKAIEVSKTIKEKKLSLQNTMSELFRILEPNQARKIIENSIAVSLRAGNDNTVFHRIVEASFSLAREIPKAILLCASKVEIIFIEALASLIVGGIENVHKISRLAGFVPSIYDALIKNLEIEIKAIYVSGRTDRQEKVRPEDEKYIQECLGKTSQTLTSIVIKKATNEILKPSLVGMAQRAIHTLANDLRKKNQDSLRKPHSEKIERTGECCRSDKPFLARESSERAGIRGLNRGRGRDLIRLDNGQGAMMVANNSNIIRAPLTSITVVQFMDDPFCFPSHISENVRGILLKHGLILTRKLIIDQINKHYQKKESIIRRDFRQMKLNVGSLVALGNSNEKKLITLLLGLILIEYKIRLEANKLMLLAPDELQKFKFQEIKIEEELSQADKLCKSALLEINPEKRILVVKKYFEDILAVNISLTTKLNLLNQFFLNYNNGENTMRQLTANPANPINSGNALVRSDFNAGQYWSEVGGAVVKEGVSSFRDFMKEAQLADLVGNGHVGEGVFIAITAFKEVTKCMMFTVQANLQMYGNVRAMAEGVLEQQKNFQQTLLQIQEKKAALLESVRDGLNLDRENHMLDILKITVEYNNKLIEISRNMKIHEDKIVEIYDGARAEGRENLYERELAQIQTHQKFIDRLVEDKNRELKAFEILQAKLEGLLAKLSKVKENFIGAMSKDNEQLNEFIKQAYAQNSKNIERCLEISREILHANIGIATKAIDAIVNRSKAVAPDNKPKDLENQTPPASVADNSLQKIAGAVSNPNRAKCTATPGKDSAVLFKAKAKFRPSEEDKSAIKADARFMQNRNGTNKPALEPAEFKKGKCFKIKLFNTQELPKNGWVKARDKKTGQKVVVPTRVLKFAK